MPTNDPVVACIAALALAALLRCRAGSRVAHAILVAEHAGGGRQRAGRARWTCTFRYNSRIDRARSRLTLTVPTTARPCCRSSRLASADTLQHHAELTSPVPMCVRWQVLAIDGHITRGDVPFTVTGP